MEIVEEDKRKTAFITPYRNYEFERIPLGVVNGPKLFHNQVCRISKDVENRAIFLDDIIYIRKRRKQVEILTKILKVFSEKNIRINKEKMIYVKQT